MEFGVDEDGAVFGGMELAFIDANGLWLELVQPTTEGPGKDFLREKGDGSLVELDFLIDDFDKNIDEFRERGIELIGMDGNPIVGDGLLREWVRFNGETVCGDERLSYLPFDLGCSTSIELLWEDPGTGVIHRRNAITGPGINTPKNAPRIDGVVVIGHDIDKLNKVYTNHLRLEHVSSDAGVNRDWMGFGQSDHSWINGNSDSIWIELVAPSSKQANAGFLGQLGEGNITELLVEVPDIEAFHDQMAGKDIVMNGGDNTALPAGAKAITNPQSGDRYAYFPLDRSMGMRIMVFQRGDGPESVFNQRDAVA